MRIFVFLCLAFAFLGGSVDTARAGLLDALKGIGQTFEGGELSDRRIIAGLKEALEIGTANAVEAVSRLNGYYGKPQIRIPLPDKVRKVEHVLRTVGFGPKLDAFEVSMNRAAERAAPEARSLFVEAIKAMTISDAQKILQGRDNEATLYFEHKTRTRLYELFKPITHDAMAEVGVTRSYQELDKRVGNLPLAGEKLDLDLDDYVTNKALDGLFFMVAEEERKIRHDPAARVTDLLKEVFGKAHK